MDAIVFSLNAVMPIILVTALGFYLRQRNYLSDTFLAEGNRFCFKYGFCAMMFTTAYKIDNIGAINWKVVAFAVAIILFLSIIGFIYVAFFVKDDAKKGVVHQAFYRSNYATIGLPLALNLGGHDAFATAALISAFSVPLYNVLGVISLTVFVRENRKNKYLPYIIIANILTNPLIIGTAAGMFCVLIRPLFGEWRLATGELKFVYQALDSVGSIAPWLSLIILGGQFRFSSVKRLLPYIIQGVIAKNFLAPIIAIVIFCFVPSLLGLRPFASHECAALFALFITPLAVATIAMTEIMNGDSELAGQILVWTVFVSAFTMLIFSAVLRMAGVF